MQTKLSSRSARLVVVVVVMSAIGASSLFAPSLLASQALPTQIRSSPKRLSGDLLGSLVSVQRHNVHDADIALFDAVRRGLNDPGFILMALRFAAMDSGSGAAQRAVALARLIPTQALAKIVLSTEAFRHGQWDEAEKHFSSAHEASERTMTKRLWRS